MKTLIVVPAYNEATTIASVLGAIDAAFDVAVVDDGSTDNTADVVHKTLPRAVVLTHIINRGLGGALRTGFLYAVLKKYDAVVTLDADGQHDPAEISSLLAALDRGADVVIGKRRTDDMPRIRQYYNKLGGLVTSILFGGPLVDSQSGYRAFRVSKLTTLELSASRMEISSEIIAEAHRHALVIIEVPITVRYTAYSMSKGQSLFVGIHTAWKLLLKSFMSIL